MSQTLVGMCDPHLVPIDSIDNRLANKFRPMESKEEAVSSSVGPLGPVVWNAEPVATRLHSKNAWKFQHLPLE